ncbi:hypothetical protein [Polyangium sp. 15x6]|uniref:hypothetical protein n=1 Tax=Polyangium sp. 15x6 TaxID=3042687 RepID=UPI00249BF695|nr:hypothetical protein [Polyangium sp. 15x6]MDI3282647.1 hypothetical protein [Polyangium sp. 15x6]
MGFAKLGMVSVACCLFAIGCVADPDDIMSIEFTGSQSLSAEDNPELPEPPTIPADARCGNNLQKVLVCHVPQGNPGNAHTICIGEPAVAHHLANHEGDSIGLCPGEEPGEEYPEYPEYPPKP